MNLRGIVVYTYVWGRSTIPRSARLRVPWRPTGSAAATARAAKRRRSASLTRIFRARRGGGGRCGEMRRGRIPAVSLTVFTSLRGRDYVVYGVRVPADSGLTGHDGTSFCCGRIVRAWVRLAGRTVSGRERRRRENAWAGLVLRRLRATTTGTNGAAVRERTRNRNNVYCSWFGRARDRRGRSGGGGFFVFPSSSSTSDQCNSSFPAPSDPAPRHRHAWRIIFIKYYHQRRNVLHRTAPVPPLRFIAFVFGGLELLQHLSATYRFPRSFRHSVSVHLFRSSCPPSGAPSTCSWTRRARR